MAAKLVFIVLASVWIGLGVGCVPVLADGGTVRFSGRRGDRLVTVFTVPAPLRAGPIDLSVLVQDAQTGRPITNLSIEVHANRIGQANAGIRAAATTEAATNKLFRAARLDLPDPGRWHLHVLVQGIAPSPPIGFDADVADPPPPWLQMSLWIAWPLLPIGLFALNQFRVKRSSGSSAVR